MAKDHSAIARDDDADLMGNDIADETREDLQSSLAGDDIDMDDMP